MDWMSQQLNNDDVKEHCHINYDLTLSLFSFFPPTQHSFPGLKSPILLPCKTNPNCTDKETIV